MLANSSHSQRPTSVHATITCASWRELTLYHPQSRAVACLTLVAVGIPAGPEENSIDTSVSSLQSWEVDAIDALTVITTHTYAGDNRAGLAAFASEHGKRLWASEFGTGSGAVQGGVQLASRIVEDLNGLNCTVWTLWQAADLDNSLSRDGWGLVATSYCGCVDGKSCECKAQRDEQQQHQRTDAAARERGEYYVRMQFYAYKQFTAFITPGSTILRPSIAGGRGNSSDAESNGGGESVSVPNTVAAVNPDGLLVLVAVNPQSTALPALFTVDTQYGTVCATVYMTDAEHRMETMGSIPLDSGKTLLKTALPAESITTFVFDPAVTNCGKPPAPPPPPPPPPPGKLAVIRLGNSSGLCMSGDADAGTVELAQCKNAGEGSSNTTRRIDLAAGARSRANATARSKGKRGTQAQQAQQAWSVVHAGGPIRLGGDSGPCLTSAGESQPATLEPCTGDPSQQWSIAVSTGHISSTGPAGGCTWQYGKDTCCLDDWNGGEHADDAVYTYSCWSPGKNQKWLVSENILHAL